MASARYKLHTSLQDDSPEVDSSSDETLDLEIVDPCLTEIGYVELVTQGTPLETIMSMDSERPLLKDMENVRDPNSIFMISPFKFDSSKPDDEPQPILYAIGRPVDRMDRNYVFMPYSPLNITRDKKSIWMLNCQTISSLKHLCENHCATVQDLTRTIRTCMHFNYDMRSLEELIDNVYSSEERGHFMSTVLSNICTLALQANTRISHPLPLLPQGINRSVTMSQRQAASLLACAFFCLFPNRFDYKQKKNTYRNFSNPNFILLYKSGPPKKIEKLKCILNYFRRITEKMPCGVITFQRFALPKNADPIWCRSTAKLCELHATNSEKIEDIKDVLQVDFANEYIGGGILGNGCVQEEIRFCICPEMIVTLLLCEKMENNECIFLIGCERFSSYKGYSDFFQYDGNFEDNTSKDNWGRKQCYLVAIDAYFFRNSSAQYDMNLINRELLKAYVGFQSQEDQIFYRLPIATGNWGCGAFNGDKHLKAIIQMMAASEAKRPLIYAAYRDKDLVTSLGVVYDYLIAQQATVRHLYQYLKQYSAKKYEGPLFTFIMNTPISSLKC